MAVIRQRGPIPRTRGTTFGGTPGVGSSFSGYVSINTYGIENLIQQVVPEAYEPYLREIGREVIATADPNVPVLTGELKGSNYVRTSISGGTAKMDCGYSANHAAPVEFGTARRGPKPYFRPAYDTVVGSGKATRRLQAATNELIDKATK